MIGALARIKRLLNHQRQAIAPNQGVYVDSRFLKECDARNMNEHTPHIH